MNELFLFSIFFYSNLMKLNLPLFRMRVQKNIIFPLLQLIIYSFFYIRKFIITISIIIYTCRYFKSKI